MPNDQEQLLAEALRAQASMANGQGITRPHFEPNGHPLPVTAPTVTDPTRSPQHPVEPGLTANAEFALLSGNDLGISYHTATTSTPPPSPPPRPASPRRFGVGRVLLLAVLLGLISGAAAGVLTML